MPEPECRWLKAQAMDLAMAMNFPTSDEDRPTHLGTEDAMNEMAIDAQQYGEVHTILDTWRASYDPDIEDEPKS